eukprot:scaffold92_cov182-Prasinococcus_capsulatus_cf.AAC.1
MIYGSGRDPAFWSWARNHAVFVYNLMPHSGIDNKVPLNVFYEQSLNGQKLAIRYHLLLPFGYPPEWLISEANRIELKATHRPTNALGEGENTRSAQVPEDHLHPSAGEEINEVPIELPGKSNEVQNEEELLPQEPKIDQEPPTPSASAAMQDNNQAANVQGPSTTSVDNDVHAKSGGDSAPPAKTSARQQVQGRTLVRAARQFEQAEDKNTILYHPDSSTKESPTSVEQEQDTGDAEGQGTTPTSNSPSPTEKVQETPED